MCVVSNWKGNGEFGKRQVLPLHIRRYQILFAPIHVSHYSNSCFSCSILWGVMLKTIWIFFIFGNWCQRERNYRPKQTDRTTTWVFKSFCVLNLSIGIKLPWKLRGDSLIKPLSNGELMPKRERIYKTIFEFAKREKSFKLT